MLTPQLIREARRRARLTQSELADRAGTTQSAIARWEAGRALPSLEKLQALVACCNLDLTVSLVDRQTAELGVLEQKLAMSPTERLKQLIAAMPFLGGELVAADATGDPGGEAPFDPLAILGSLMKHEVRYVLVGGLAATMHGSPFLSTDVDIAPERDAENLGRLAAALNELRAHDPTETPGASPAAAHSPDSLASRAVHRLSTPLGTLDILFEPAGTSGYEDLRAHSEVVEVAGISISVASLADVIRSKEAAGRAEDRSTIPTLRRLQRITSSG